MLDASATYCILEMIALETAVLLIVPTTWPTPCMMPG
jgi:hypothetical protein